MEAARSTVFLTSVLFTVRGVAGICNTVACWPWWSRLAARSFRSEIQRVVMHIWLIHVDLSGPRLPLLYLPPRKKGAKHAVIFHLFFINAKLNAVDEILCGWRGFAANIG